MIQLNIQHGEYNIPDSSKRNLVHYLSYSKAILAQRHYSNQWGISEVLFLLIENYSQYPTWWTWMVPSAIYGDLSGLLTMKTNILIFHLLHYRYNPKLTMVLESFFKHICQYISAGSRDRWLVIGKMLLVWVPWFCALTPVSFRLCCRRCRIWGV